MLGIAKEQTGAYQHDHSAILALTAPILRRMGRVVSPVRLTKTYHLAAAGQHKTLTYVESPPERTDTRPNDWVLINCNDFLILEDRQGLLGRSR